MKKTIESDLSIHEMITGKCLNPACDRPKGWGFCCVECKEAYYKKEPCTKHHADCDYRIGIKKYEISN